MKLSRKFRRNRYSSHRRKIDLFASGTTVGTETSSCTEGTFSMPDEDRVDAIRTSTEPRTVKEAFEAFKKSCQNAS